MPGPFIPSLFFHVFYTIRSRKPCRSANWGLVFSGRGLKKRGGRPETGKTNRGPGTDMVKA